MAQHEHRALAVDPLPPPSLGTTTAPLPAAARGGQPDRPAGHRSGLLRAIAAVASGLVLVLAFPPYGVWPLAPLGAAGLALAVRGTRARTAFVLGTLAGLALFVPLLSWVDPVGRDAWLAFAVVESLPLGLLGVALAAVGRLPGWPVWSATLWVAEEAVRGRVPFGGVTWGRLAFSQGHTPFSPYAALGGAPLVSFAVALAGGLAAWAAVLLGTGITGRRGDGNAAAEGRLPAAPPAVRALAAVVAALAVGAGGLAVPHRAAAAGSITVAVVQGNVPRLGLEFNAQREAVLRNHVAGTVRLADDVRAGTLPAPDIVIWPENSSDIDPLRDTAAGALITDAARQIDRPLLVGAVLDGPGRFVSNAGIVWDPRTGPGARYVKRHPVPFGEYIPFRPQLSRLVSRVSLVPRDFVSGRRPGVLAMGPVRLGDVICFEIAYDGLVRDVVTRGAQLLTVQTNNATFGRSGETYQQLAMSQLRAVEHRRTVVVAATSGVSAIITPDGVIRQDAPVFTAANLVARVPLGSGRTLSDRLGAAPEWFLSLIGLLALAAALLTARVTTARPRRRTGT